MRDIENSIKELVGSSGFVILSVGEYYIQLAKDEGSTDVLFEAVSPEYLPSLPDKEIEFKALGFDLEPGSNFQKTMIITDETPALLMSELIRIFEEIYQVPLVNYQLKKDLESDNQGLQYERQD